GASANRRAPMPNYFEIDVTLCGAERRIWRRFLLSDDASFENLHEAIQVACGWEPVIAAGGKGPEGLMPLYPWKSALTLVPKNPKCKAGARQATDSPRQTRQHGRGADRAAGQK